MGDGVMGRSVNLFDDKPSVPKPTSVVKSPRIENPFDDLILDSAKRHNVDPDLIRAMTRQESGFKRKAVSNKGAQGLMQLMPGTATRFGVKEIGRAHV